MNTSRLLIFFMLFLGASSVYSQRKITGVVSDATEPLIGVNVTIEGKGEGTVTDFDGKYELEVESGNSLVFSYIGYQTEIIEITDQTSLDLTMSPSANELDEVLVVSYGTSSKATYTGSVTQIGSEDLEKRPLTNVANALTGSAAGLQVGTAGGAPGDGPEFRIRGFGSINASAQPLIILDGARYDGVFSSINPGDIQSISVLKDAASTSLYGSDAANGVVMIQTKSGQQGKDRFQVNLSQGISTRGLQEYDRLGPDQYYEVMWEALRNGLAYSDGVELSDANQMATDEIFSELGYNPFNVPDDQIVGTDGKINPNAELLYPDDLDWEDALSRTGYRTEAGFSYNGASKKTNYFLSLGYLKDQGYALNTDFERFTGRINLVSDVRDWLEAGLNLAGTVSLSNNSNSGTNSIANPFRAARYTGPIYPIYEHDPQTGDYILDDDGQRIFDIGELRASGASPGRHALQELLLNVDEYKRDQITAVPYVKVKFLKNFDFTARASYLSYTRQETTYDNTIVGDGAPAGRIGLEDRAITSLTLNQLLNWNKAIGRHNIGVLLGHESYEYQRSRSEISRSGQIASGILELNNFTTTQDVDSRTERLTKEGYLSRFTYDWDSKYLFSASFRRDASSRFNKDVRWENFWSISGGWLLHKESFLNLGQNVNLLKLRASYGQVGNDLFLDEDNLSDFYPSQALYQLGENNALEPGIRVFAPGNPDLTWESNNQFDAAIEFALFDFRVNGTLEYYDRFTDGLLFRVPAPLESGFRSIPINVGNMSNSGIELDINADVIRKKNWRWNLGFNASTINNEIKELPQEEIIRGTKLLRVGGSIYDYYLRRYEGVDPADGAALYRASEDAIADESENLRQINGIMVTTDPNESDREIVGTAIPDLFGALNTKIEYKDFGLQVLATYQLGGETYDDNYQSLMSTADYGRAKHVDILQRWQNPGDVTNIPRMDAIVSSDFDATSDRWLISSTHLILRQVTLSYDLPTRFISRGGLTGANMYVSGENLAFFSKRKGLDVGQEFNGVTNNRYVPSRIMTLGLQVQF